MKPTDAYTLGMDELAGHLFLAKSFAPGRFYVYVLTLGKIPAFYVGMTGRLTDRLGAHAAKRGAVATEMFGVRRLVKLIACESAEEARAIEQRETDRLDMKGYIAFGGSRASWSAMRQHMRPGRRGHAGRVNAALKRIKALGRAA